MERTCIGSLLVAASLLVVNANAQTVEFELFVTDVAGGFGLTDAALTLEPIDPRGVFDSVTFAPAAPFAENAVGTDRADVATLLAEVGIALPGDSLYNVSAFPGLLDTPSSALDTVDGARRVYVWAQVRNATAWTYVRALGLQASFSGFTDAGQPATANDLACCWYVLDDRGVSGSYRWSLSDPAQFTSHAFNGLAVFEGEGLKLGPTATTALRYRTAVSGSYVWTFLLGALQVPQGFTGTVRIESSQGLLMSDGAPATVLPTLVEFRASHVSACDRFVVIGETPSPLDFAVPASTSLKFQYDAGIQLWQDLSTPLASGHVITSPAATGDSEPDCDVDLADFAEFQCCFGVAAPLPAQCAVFDFDDNGAIDTLDMLDMLAALESSGASRCVEVSQRVYVQGLVESAAACDVLLALFDDANADNEFEPREARRMTVSLNCCDYAVCPTVDCNANGINDYCDVAYLGLADCNENGIPDECDLANGTSTDCDADGVPDECSAAVCSGGPPATFLFDGLGRLRR